MNKDNVEVLLIRVAFAIFKMLAYLFIGVTIIVSGLFVLLSVREIDIDVHVVLAAVLFLIGVALITWRDYNAKN